MASIVLIGLGVALPFLPIFAIVAGLFWWTRRRRYDADGGQDEYVDV